MISIKMNLDIFKQKIKKKEKSKDQIVVIEKYLNLVEEDYNLTKETFGLIDDYLWEMKWQENGFWCGYVTIPENYGLDYYEINDLFLEVGNLEPVHGGLTYSFNNKYGFDCGHYNDMSLINLDPGSSYRDSVYVKSQISNLIFNFKKLDKHLKEIKTSLIHNPKSIKKFWDMFYENKFDDDIVFMTLLMQREKYSDFKQTNLMKERDIIDKNDYKQFLNKIKSYTNDKCNVVYSSLNPLSSYKAYILFRQKIDNVINERINSNKTSWSKSGITNLNNTLKTCIQKSVYDKKWIILDLDVKLQYFELKKYLTYFDINPFCIIETKNGYHFILDNKKLTSLQKKEIFTGKLTNWLFECKDKNGKLINKNVVDILSTDVFTPIPGTIQGGFKVDFV